MPSEKKRRRARGLGTVFRRPDGTWVGRVVIGRTPTGRTLYRERWGRTQAEVIRRLREAGPPGPSVTLSAWADRWLAAIQVRPATRAGYASSASRAKAMLGGLRVVDLTPTRVEQYAAELARDGLHPNTVRLYVAQLATMLQGAVRDGLIANNPARLARKPRGRRKPIDPFPPADLARIVAVATVPAEWPFALMAAIGCRIGEAAALDVADFDPAAGTVSITKTYTADHGLRPPKTPQGVRVVRVPRQAIPAVLAAVGSRTSGPLFADEAGARRDPRTVLGAWARLLRRLGLAYRNPHQLRHSVASARVAARDPVADVARDLGDRPDTITRTYTHATGADSAATMERLLSGDAEGGDKVGDKPPAGGKAKPRH